MSSRDEPKTVEPSTATANNDNAESSDLVVDETAEDDGTPEDDGAKVNAEEAVVETVIASAGPGKEEPVHEETNNEVDGGGETEPPLAKPEGGTGVDGPESAADDGAPPEADATKQEEVPPVEEEEELGEPIEYPAEMDVLSGRGAAVNSRPGNRKFRALCFAHKPHFEVGNHAAKRRIATEIVALMFRPTDGAEPSRFLKRRVGDRGSYYAMTEEQAILKAQQVMRDYKRPDRVAARELLAQNGNARKRTRQVESTPMIDVPVPDPPEEPIIENPFGVHGHDVLSGRGAFVNGHVGNERLRKLAQERKRAFDSGSYTEKRQLATEIVQIIRSLDPPGRFLKRVAPKKPSKQMSTESDSPEAISGGTVPPEKGSDDNKGPTDEGGTKPSQPQDAGEGNEARTDEGGSNIIDGIWEELSDEMSIHKTCQVMRDIARPDRKHREERRQERKRIKMLGGPAAAKTDPETSEVEKLVPENDPAVVDTHTDDEAKADGVAVGGSNEDMGTEEMKEEVENKDVEMKDVSSLAEKAAVEVVDKALDGTPSEQATMETPADGGAIEV